MSAPATTVQVEQRNWIWPALWMLMFLGAVLAAGNAVVFLTLDGYGHPEIRARFTATALAGWAHALGGAIAIFLGAFQFVPGVRRGYRRVHIWVGRVYLLAVLVGALGGLYFAPTSVAGTIGTLGFTLLGVAWISTALRAYVAIRARDVAAHRRWMIRNYALTFAAATLRIELVVLQISGVAFVTALQIVAWLCWIPNWLVVEAWIRRRPAAHVSDAAAVSMNRP